MDVAKEQLVEQVGISYEIANQQKEEYDVVVEAVGTPEAIDNAINIAIIVPIVTPTIPYLILIIASIVFVSSYGGSNDMLMKLIK